MKPISILTPKYNLTDFPKLSLAPILIQFLNNKSTSKTTKLLNMFGLFFMSIERTSVNTLECIT